MKVATVSIRGRAACETDQVSTSQISHSPRPPLLQTHAYQFPHGPPTLLPDSIVGLASLLASGCRRAACLPNRRRRRSRKLEGRYPPPPFCACACTACTGALCFLVSVLSFASEDSHSRPRLSFLLRYPHIAFDCRNTSAGQWCKPKVEIMIEHRLEHRLPCIRIPLQVEQPLSWPVSQGNIRS